ncbi:MAG: TolC family protein [Chloroflexota bacterium]
MPECFPQVTGPLRLTVEEARNMAVQNNINVRTAKVDVDYANKKVWETVAMGLPQISATANYQHQFTVPQISFGSFLDPGLLPEGPLSKTDIMNAYSPAPTIPLGVRNNTIFDFTLSQLIFSGEYIVGLQAFRILKKVSEKALVKTEQQIRESVAGAYYSILVIDENERVLQESLKSTQQTYDELARMNEEGLIEETDVEQVKISITNLQSRINTLNAQKALAFKLLKFQLGMDFDDELVLTDSLKGIIDQGNIQYLSSTEFDINNSIDYQIIQNQERVSELMLKRQKSKLLPVISGFYRHQEQTNQPAFNFVVKDIAGVSLTLPIITSGQRIATINQARLDLEKARLNTENVYKGLVMEYETALTDYQTAFNNYSANLESMNLGKKIYDRTVIKYREGVASSFEMVQNQAQYLMSESSYYNSVLALLSSKAKLDRILSEYSDQENIQKNK